MEVAEQKKLKVPKLRFREFEDEWKESRLENLLKDLKSGKTSANGQGEFAVYGSTGIIGKTDEFTHSGDYILIARVGANAGAIQRVNGCFAVTDNTLVLDFLDESCITFVECVLTRFNLNRLVFGSGQPLVTGGQLKAIPLNLPNLPEQQKIAGFLSAVDEKLKHLGRKKELLQQYKKGVMQQLFSQELRFKREDGSDYEDWEEKRLGEVAVFSKGKGISKSDIVEDGATPCIRYGELYTHYQERIEHIVSRTDVPVSQLTFSKANDVIIPSSGETQLDIAKASCVMFDGIALGGDLNVIRTEQDGLFLAYYMNSAKKFEIAQMAQGNSVVHLYSSQLKDLYVQLPCLEEQQKIAAFLSSLDRKIDAVSAQIELTQQFKKGLLQEMFV